MGTYVNEGKAPCNDLPIWVKPWISDKKLWISDKKRWISDKKRWISDKQPCALLPAITLLYVEQYSSAFDEWRRHNRKRLTKTLAFGSVPFCSCAGKALVMLVLKPWKDWQSPVVLTNRIVRSDRPQSRPSFVTGDPHWVQVTVLVGSPQFR
jgi:hypothetical protein